MDLFSLRGLFGLAGPVRLTAEAWVAAATKALPPEGPPPSGGWAGDGAELAMAATMSGSGDAMTGIDGLRTRARVSDLDK